MRPEWERGVRTGDTALLQRLLEAGADVDARDRYGQTGLMLAAVAGRADVVRLLIRHGANLDHTAKYGLTAVMLAVVNGHAEVVRLLADAGASLDQVGSGAPGFAGKTALDLAGARGDPVIVDILRRAAGSGR
jgi:ankyrin repeat protein